MKTVKRIMIQEEGDLYTLYGKTLTRLTNIGWFVGFIKTEHGSYIFVTNVDDSGTKAKSITVNILKKYDLITSWPCKMGRALNLMLKTIMIHKLFNQIVIWILPVKFKFDFFHKFSVTVHMDGSILTHDAKLRLKCISASFNCSHSLPAFQSSNSYTSFNSLARF